MQGRCTPEVLAGAKRIHVMGLCGTAMGTFAGMLKGQGVEVRGSDAGAYPPMSDLLAEWGIDIMLGYRPENLDWNPDLVIVGNVIRRTNPEAEAVRSRGLPYVSFPEAFGERFLATRHPVVLTGTHGKTTTTTLTAWLLEEGGLDPTMLVGGAALNFGASFKLGAGAHVVVEGDEYDTAYFDKVPKFVHYRPQTAVITNIEFDHADIYRDVEHIEGEFARFVDLIGPDGRLLYWAGDERASRVASRAACPVQSYAIGDGDAYWRAVSVSESRSGTTFTLLREGEPVGRLTTPLFGDHNLQNTLAAVGVAMGEGVSLDAIEAALPRFLSVKKRQELKGEVDGIWVMDDFAHHPTAVRATVSAVKRRFEGGRLFCCFEVESNTSRRRIFQADYPSAFDGAHAVLFCKPLEKKDNLPPEERIDLDAVVAAIRKRGALAELIAEVDDIVAWLTPRLEPGDVVLGMSGRHFYGLHAKVLEALRKRSEQNR